MRISNISLVAQDRLSFLLFSFLLFRSFASSLPLLLAFSFCLFSFFFFSIFSFSEFDSEFFKVHFIFGATFHLWNILITSQVYFMLGTLKNHSGPKWLTRVKSVWVKERKTSFSWKVIPWHKMGWKTTHPWWMLFMVRKRNSTSRFKWGN